MAGLLKSILLYLLLLTGVLAVIHFAMVAWGRHELPKVAVSYSPRIPILSHDFVYDLSGSEASGLGDAMKLFDEDADPKQRPESNPGTSPLPVVGADKFFPPGKGLRIVIDLQGLYSLDELYWYDRSPESDSVWLYTGDMGKWQPAAAYYTAGAASRWGWKTFHLGMKSRFVMIRFNSKTAVLTEMALYGRLLEKAALTGGAMGASSGGSAPERMGPVLKEFAGTNLYDFPPLSLLEPFSNARIYQLMPWYDTDTVHAYPANRIELPAAPGLFADSLRRLGKRCWISLRGVPLWMDKKGFNERDKPVSAPGMNTEDPLSYGRHAKLYRALGRQYGVTNKGSMGLFENGNEEDGWWTDKYWSPLEYFAVSAADYDGDEGRLGPDCGLLRGDTACRLVMSGLVQLDTNRVRTLKFLCSRLRRDGKFLWEGGVQYHYYSTNSAGINQMPTRGISPEEDRMREKLAKVRLFHDRLFHGIPLILGENGYDRNQESRQRTPLLKGYTDGHSQGSMGRLA
ncbi:MAG: hypothetical protein JST39_00570, partial [Bacteroidetes bacterium]|nr:hypothetical protein [Bacteroidota bacterium]